MTKCWNCGTEAVQTGFYTYLETTTVETLKWPKCYCEPGYCECEPRTGLEDQTYNEKTLIFKCPACGLQFQTDRYGQGLGELDQDKTPEQQQDKYGDFHRLAPDPQV